MEDALKRLDKLTQEEARMAVAQNLKATYAVDERVKGVANTVVAIDNRVSGVDDKVKGIDTRVANVDDRVKVVDNKVVEVIHGAHLIFSQSRNDSQALNCSGGKEANLIMQQAADDLDQMKRLSSPNLISTLC
jgi:hypothetical protein